MSQTTYLIQANSALTTISGSVLRNTGISIKEVLRSKRLEREAIHSCKSAIDVYNACIFSIHIGFRGLISRWEAFCCRTKTNFVKHTLYIGLHFLCVPRYRSTRRLLTEEAMLIVFPCRYYHFRPIISVCYRCFPVFLISDFHTSFDTLCNLKSEGRQQQTMSQIARFAVFCTHIAIVVLVLYQIWQNITYSSRKPSCKT